MKLKWSGSTTVLRAKRVIPCALIPTQPGRRLEEAKPVDVARLHRLLENYRKTHPYNPPPPPELPLLERTEALLTDYCTSLPGGDEAERCYTALEYYEQQKKEAESGCEVVIQDGRVQEEGCEPQHRLEDFVRNLVGQAPMQEFVQTLLVLRSAQQQKRSSTPQEEDSSINTTEEAIKERRERLTRLFYALDKDLNGKLDIAEFREGMQQAGQELSGSACAQVLSTMGVHHGFLQLEEFLAIAEVEERVARSALANWIRTKSSTDRDMESHLL